MRINFLGYSLRTVDGYGRFSTYLMEALERQGIEVTADLTGIADAKPWVQERHGIAWDRLTISCIPPFYLRKVPGRHWLITMTEGSELPDGWRKTIENANIERVIVPCQHNADVFANGGVSVPISVIPGGIEPDDLPLVTERPERPYTFLALADRGKRKGWTEAYAAFYMAFGSATQTPDVRLIIKCRPEGNELIEMIATADNLDPRLTFLMRDMDMNEFYEMGDCFVIPSRSEGWGLPHRECAAKGIPVITQAYSGMDDGHTSEWASVIKHGRMEPIDNTKDGHIKGQWRVVDREELAKAMEWCYAHREAAAVKYGEYAATWLRRHQTWDHSAAQLVQLLQREGVLEPERVYA